MAGTLKIARFCLMKSYVEAVSLAGLGTHFLVNILTMTWAAQVVNLQCIDSHSPVNIYNVVTQPIPAGLLCHSELAAHFPGIKTGILPLLYSLPAYPANFFGIDQHH